MANVRSADHVTGAASSLSLDQNTTGGFFPSQPTRFKQAWWLGNANDNNAGTVVYDSAAPVLGKMTPNG